MRTIELIGKDIALNYFRAMSYICCHKRDVPESDLLWLYDKITEYFYNDYLYYCAIENRDISEANLYAVKTTTIRCNVVEFYRKYYPNQRVAMESVVFGSVTEDSPKTEYKDD